MAGTGKRGCVALALVALIACLAPQQTSSGIIKDIYQKVTHSGNKTEEPVRESAPICGSGAFSSPNEASLSPEIIFISNRLSRVTQTSGASADYPNEGRRETRAAAGERLREVANEFRFHVENVTLEELERRGFNREAPVTFLVHGFTSGYPLQAWISAIVEAYTLERSDRNVAGASEQSSGGFGRDEASSQDYRRRRDRRDSATAAARRGQSQQHQQGGAAKRLEHNLFIVNWHYAARGINYPRAVANIPIVASYVTRFINDKLIGEAQVEPRQIQLVGHSLGAHLVGFVGKNTRSKLGQIYGLDPAGPCFGSLSGPLYPSSKRLAPTDADQVITIHTNSALLGIGKPLGRYSVFVEGGASQPGCKNSDNGILRSLGTLTLDGGNLDTLACSHSRAPNLLTYRHDQSDSDDDCQLVAYACKDWHSFLEGKCGVCSPSPSSSASSGSPLREVECLRIGLDWQYVSAGRQKVSTRRPTYSNNDNNQNEDSYLSPATSSRRPSSSHGSSGNNHNHDDGYSGNHSSNSDGHGNGSGHNSNSGGRRTTSRRPSYSAGGQRRRRAANESAAVQPDERRLFGGSQEVEPINMFLRTGDTQPYCAFQYQIVLELNEPFGGRKKTPMSIILQDSQSDSNRRQSAEQNSLSSDDFGNKFDERTYTHLLTSNKKLKRIDHSTLIFRDGLPNGHSILKTLHVNYMSHSDGPVRKRLSSRLCPVKTETDQTPNSNSEKSNNRFFFRPCQDSNSHSANHNSNSESNSHNHNYNDHNSNHETNSGSHNDDFNSSGHSTNHNNNNFNGHNQNSNHHSNGHNNNNNGYNHHSNHNGGNQNHRDRNPHHEGGNNYSDSEQNSSRRRNSNERHRDNQ